MASIFRREGLVLALVILVVISLSFLTISVAEARSPYSRERQLATDCNSRFQGQVAGCAGRSSGSPTPPRPRPRPGPGGPAPGSSRCRNGCCGKDKFGRCVCC